MKSNSFYVVELSLCFIVLAAVYKATGAVGLSLFLGGLGIAGLLYGAINNRFKTVIPSVFAIAIAMWLGWATWGVMAVRDLVVPSAASSPPSSTASAPDRTNQEESSKLAELGQTGDLFGGINALFAAFAFVGVAVAAVFQYRTTEMLERQIRQQSFEPLFFELLKRPQPPANYKFSDHNHLRSSESATWENEDPEIAPACTSLRQLICGNKSEIAEPFIRPEFLVDKARLTYQKFYKENRNELAPYYRKLFHTFKFIEKSTLAEKEKNNYANIARASLNSDDLFLLILNATSQEGQAFIPLIERFGIIKHLDRGHNEDRLDFTLAKWMMDDSAWKSASERDFYWNQYPAKRRELQQALDAI